ncbi:MAG: ABC transporter ATP-binding protein [Actinomyces sp.]|nr:ABC transporter ATP-binding protein [Actinomyces sp.]
MPERIPPIIEVDDLRMSYGNPEVLRGVDLRLEAGDVLGLLGPNGAGKTTTIEILEGFRRRSSGRVLVLGQDPAHGDEAWRARLGIVLQDWRDHRRWRVRELLDHLGCFYHPYRAPGRPRPLRTDDLLEHLGLGPSADTQVSRLSGGQRRRLDVAVGLVGNPELLFLDEPTTGFDPQARHDFHRLIEDITRTTDTAIVLTTHDLAEAESLSTRIAILDRGQIVIDETPELLTTRLTGHAVVSYRLDDRRHEHRTPVSDVENVVRRLLLEYPRTHGLEVTRPSLESAYLDLVGTRVARDVSDPRTEVA